MIRIDQFWLATEPMDMRAGFDAALARVVRQFGEARAHHAYLFTNKRANRLKVLVHDGFGLWLASRRLHQGRFIWAKEWQGAQVLLHPEQLRALVIGLPWRQVGADNAIAIL